MVVALDALGEVTVNFTPLLGAAVSYDLCLNVRQMGDLFLEKALLSSVGATEYRVN